METEHDSVKFFCLLQSQLLTGLLCLSREVISVNPRITAFPLAQRTAAVPGATTEDSSVGLSQEERISVVIVRL